MKKFTSLLGLVLWASLLWAAPRPAQEFDQEANEYKEYWLASVKKHEGQKYGALLFIDDLRYFCEQHPKCLLSRVDLATELLKIKDNKNGVEELKAAKQLLASVPETEEGKFALAKYYRLSTEASALGKAIGYSGGQPSSEASLCAKYNQALGAEAFYALANFYTTKGDVNAGGRTFLSARKYDKDFALTTAEDVKNYHYCCSKQLLGAPLISSYFNKLFASKGFKYFQDFGAVAASAYEQLGDKEKAAFASILDKEYTLTYKDSSPDDLIAILKKNYTTANAQKAIAFIEKFYNDKDNFSEDDLNVLPKNIHDFLPVRYMYKMKSSNDIAALREEFEPFFKTVGNFYIRLYEKAEKAGDKKNMAELKEILSQPIHNAHGRNRLTK